jgi:type II secretory ATPase GspE/PulE/Tfp pilus assembly ATPase PilB-like protein
MTSATASAVPPQAGETTPEAAVARLLEEAARMGASDLFFAPNEDHVAVSVRHLGLVRPLAVLPGGLGHHCIAAIKARAGMNVVEHRRPLDGRWIYDHAGGRIDLRITTIPTLHGEDCSVRLLDHQARVLQLEDLGLVRRQFNDLLAMLNSPSGLLLVTGPTGAGKTTTLYSCLRYLNDGRRKINTIEDPVEYEVEGVRQTQVQPRLDLGFPELLRSVLRQAPDVIMIGEIRDAQTAATAVHAANSGHLVLATLHAPLAAGAVQSMRAWGAHPHFLAGSLLGVVAQRLVRTLCVECRTLFPLTHAPHTFDEVRPWLEPGQGLSLLSARGCPACHQTGYAGRTGVFEVLRVGTVLRGLIADGQPTAVLREQAVREGLIELRQAALLQVALGRTTAEEVVRAVPPEYLGVDA